MGKKAFTLAEVLVTLGVIGVVSALTMPALVQHFKDMVLISQAKKSYTNFLNVIKRMEAENECTNYADIFATGESAAQIAKNIAEFYNGSQVCATKNQGCGSEYKVKTATPLNNGTGGISLENFGFPRINNIDGSSIYLRNIRDNCMPYTYTVNKKDENGFYTGETYTATETRCATVIIDVNGEFKGPNQYGADVHQIIVLDKKFEPNDGYFGCLKSIFVNNKLNYKKYSDNTKF